MKNALALLFFFSTLFCFSQENNHIIDIENSKCLENAVPVTIGSIKCEQAALVSWKTEMDKALKQLKADPKLLDVALLKQTQSKWLAFHESDVTFYQSYYQIHYQGGSMAIAAAVSYEKRQLRKRVLYLLELYEELHE